MWERDIYHLKNVEDLIPRTTKKYFYHSVFETCKKLKTKGYEVSINIIACSKDSSKTEVDSLLDIIQGACANKGSIIFATTNNFETIKKMCPRLFRDGRFIF